MSSQPGSSVAAVAPYDRRWVAALRRFVAAARDAAARCELCGRPMDLDHEHLIDPASRRTACACGACARRAERGDCGSLRRMPAQARALEDFRISDADWDALRVPIGLAFFHHSSTEDRVVAMYPGAAGAVESLLDLQAWRALVDANPVLAELQPDAEALLVRRVGAIRQYFRAPIDHCFALAGLIRTQWHGLAGGAEVWRSIDRFFDDLAAGRPWRHRDGHA